LRLDPNKLSGVVIGRRNLVSASKQPEEAKALIKFLASPAAAAAIVKSGLEPMSSSAQK